MKQINLRIDDELLTKLDAARAKMAPDISRNAWLLGLLRTYLLIAESAESILHPLHHDRWRD